MSNDVENEVYLEIARDLKESDSYDVFYDELIHPPVAISSPIDVKVIQAKEIMLRIEKAMIPRLGNKQYVKITFNKTYPADVIDAVVRIYEDHDWFVSPRMYPRPYPDRQTKEKIYGNLYLNVEPIPEGKIIDSMEAEDHYEDSDLTE